MMDVLGRKASSHYKNDLTYFRLPILPLYILYRTRYWQSV